jgi:hypothetical protein
VPNDQLKLKPGMTATVTIEIARRNDVIRVPNAALRFRPNADTFAALNQAVPPEMQRGAGRGGMGGPGAPGAPGAGGPPAAGAPAASGQGGAAPSGATRGDARGQSAPSAATPPSRSQGGQPGSRATEGAGSQPAMDQGQRGGGQGGFGGQTMSPEERRRRFEERMASMSPEERAQFEARMRERGMDQNNPGGGRGGFGPGGPGGANQAGRTGAPGSARPSAEREPSANRAGAQTIDQLFGPLPVTETSGRVWVEANGQLKSVRVRLGITDGTYTELLSGELQPGQELVTSVVTPAQAAAAATRSPLMPGGPGGGRGPGGMPSGGGQRGGGR